MSLISAGNAGSIALKDYNEVWTLHPTSLVYSAMRYALCDPDPLEKGQTEILQRAKAFVR